MRPLSRHALLWPIAPPNVSISCSQTGFIDLTVDSASDDDLPLVSFPPILQALADLHTVMPLHNYPQYPSLRRVFSMSTTLLPLHVAFSWTSSEFLRVQLVLFWIIAQLLHAVLRKAKQRLTRFRSRRKIPSSGSSRRTKKTSSSFTKLFKFLYLYITLRNIC